LSEIDESQVSESRPGPSPFGVWWLCEWFGGQD
jgi:hypothetical protein